MLLNPLGIVFFFKDTANTEIYTLSLHDALPIFAIRLSELEESVVIILGTLKRRRIAVLDEIGCFRCGAQDRKSTRLNSSHTVISYAVFCLKKKKIITLRMC